MPIFGLYWKTYLENSSFDKINFGLKQGMEAFTSIKDCNTFVKTLGDFEDKDLFWNEKSIGFSFEQEFPTKKEKESKKVFVYCKQL